MKKQHINELWLKYRNQVIPRDAPSTQLIECRRAFYAGAQAFYGTVMGTLQDTGNPDDVTDFDLSLMEGLDAELRQFNEQVKAGVA